MLCREIGRAKFGMGHYFEDNVGEDSDSLGLDIEIRHLVTRTSVDYNRRICFCHREHAQVAILLLCAAGALARLIPDDSAATEAALRGAAIRPLR
jgi:hypothetical protein